MQTPDHYASQYVDPDSIPWIPLGPGESFKPLRFLANDRGRVLLLRMEPGTTTPRHRHTGEVHATNISGRRQLIESGEIVGPGGYVYEPAGNVDTWMAIGDEPVVVHIAAYGIMESFNDAGDVVRRDSAATLRECYLAYCREHGIAALNLDAQPAHGGAR